MYGFNAYNSKAVPTISEGKRLAVVRYKNTKKQKAQFSNVCVQVPAAVAGESDYAQLHGHILAMITAAQDGIIRSLHESGKNMVSDSQLSISAVREYLDSEAESGRLSKDDVIAWFAESVQDTLSVALADKLGISDTPTQAETDRITAMIAVYREKFASLAGGKTQFSVENAVKLQRALEVSGADDELAVRFTARLTKMQQIEQDTLLAL